MKILKTTSNLISIAKGDPSKADNKKSIVNPLPFRGNNTNTSLKPAKAIFPLGFSVSKEDYRGPAVFIDPQFLGELIVAENKSHFELSADRKDSSQSVQDLIDSILLKNNFILIHGPITMNLANEVRMKTQLIASAMNKKNELKPVHFLINSPGGLIVAMNAILDAMDRLKNTKINGENIVVATYCDGFAASAASVILTNGTKGYRYLSPRSEVMIHQPLGGIGGQATDMDIGNKRIQKMKADIRDFFARTTNMSKEELDKVMERDHWMDSSESKKQGFIDHIYSDFPTKELDSSKLKELF